MNEQIDLQEGFTTYPTALIQLVRAKAISFEVADFYQAIWRLSQKFGFCYASNGHLYKALTGKDDEVNAKRYCTHKLQALKELKLVRVELDGLRPNGSRGRLVYPLPAGQSKGSGVTSRVTVGSQAVSPSGSQAVSPEIDLRLNSLSLEERTEIAQPKESTVLFSRTQEEHEPYRTVDELTFEMHVKGAAISVFQAFEKASGQKHDDAALERFLEEVRERAQAYADTAASGVKFLKRDAARIAREVLESKVAVKKLASDLKRTQRAESAQLEAQAAAKAARTARTSQPRSTPTPTTTPAYLRPFQPVWEKSEATKEREDALRNRKRTENTVTPQAASTLAAAFLAAASGTTNGKN